MMPRRWSFERDESKCEVRLLLDGKPLNSATSCEGTEYKPEHLEDILAMWLADRAKKILKHLNV